MTAAAEAALSEAVINGRHGGAVYFWARSDGRAGTLHRDCPVAQPEDFWAYCDSINSGQCRYAFLIATSWYFCRAREFEGISNSLKLIVKCMELDL